jgi:hypothetical protein
MAAVQHMGKVGVCISGQVRTLMSPWVLEGFEKHVAAPLVRAGYTADVHAALVADLSRHEEYVLHRSLRQALPSSTPLVSFALLGIEESWAPCHRFSCQVQFPPKANDWFPNADAPQAARDTEVGFKSMVVQYTSIRACYEQVVRHERTTKEYIWLYRMRTDFVPLEDMPLPTLAREAVHVPFGQYPCMNDHAFLCPRQLCHAHFNLLELWESRFCTQVVHTRHPATDAGKCALRQTEGANSMAWLLDHRHQAGLSQVPNSNSSLTPPLITPDAPTSPFVLPPAPIDMGPAWYWFARYTQGRTCQRNDVLGVPHCCESARLRVMSWAYSIARGHAMAGYLQFCPEFGFPVDDMHFGRLANRTLAGMGNKKRQALKHTCDRLARQMPFCKRRGTRDLNKGMSEQCESNHSRLAILVGSYASMYAEQNSFES